MISKEVLATIKLAAAAQNIPPEAIDKAVEVVEDLNALLQSSIERNRAQAFASNLASVEKLRSLGRTAEADEMLAELLADGDGDEEPLANGEDPVGPAIPSA